MYCYWGWESVAIAANSCTIADQLLANQSADCFVIDGNGQTSLLPASAASQLRNHYILILSYMNCLLLSFSVREILYLFKILEKFSSMRINKLRGKQKEYA